jgi:outer membrane protein
MKKQVTFSLVAVLAALSFAAVPSQAQAQTKVGMVDMNKIFSSYYKTKDAEARINEARARAKRDLDDRMDTYKKTMDDINQLNAEIDRPELSKELKEEKMKSRDDKIAETKNLEREITEFRQQKEKDLQDQAVRMRNAIVDEITKLVQDKVKSDNYDLVFDKSGQSLNGVPIVLYSKDAMDFSDDIITALNKDRPKGAAASPSKPE